MKNFNKYFLMSTVALSGMVGMTACSSDDNGGNPETPGTAESVKTQFALNVPYAANGTRMTEENTQGEGKNFLGITNMQLMTFKATPDVDAPIGSNYTIGSSENAYDKDNYRRVFRDVAIPIGTTDMVLYGVAPRTGDDYFGYGYIQTSDTYSSPTAASLEDLNFSLKQIQPTANFSTNEEAKAIIAALNKILASSATVEGEGELKWATIGDGTAEKKFLQTRYNSFVKLTSGSANTVRKAINGLQAQLGEKNSAKPLTNAILENCDAAITALEKNGFPTDLNLPEGSARLKYNNTPAEPAFSYVAATASQAGDNAINYNSITYPASLAYFVSSPAMVSDKELTSLSLLPNYDAWVANPSTAWSGTGFTKSAVSSTTRSVGLQNPLQYGVASLKLSVRTEKDFLEDNAVTTGGMESNNKIAVGPTTFKLTGVLVGGQPTSVGWNFEPELGCHFTNAIYDKKINGSTRRSADGSYYVKNETTPSLYNYTLVLDNNREGRQDQVVYVTLEFVNNGPEFYGENGLVPNGGTFYLVGQLDLNNGKDLGTDVDHIFTKDHTTIANFTIGSLKKAYNCIPDLRSSQISIGLAVDLTWQKGVQFDYTID